MLQVPPKNAEVSVNEGIKRYGEKAIEAILSEFNQSDNKEVSKPRDPNHLTAHEKKETLNLKTMIKQKRDGKIKGRACVDGRKQRRYIKKRGGIIPNCTTRESNDNLINWYIFKSRRGHS